MSTPRAAIPVPVPDALSTGYWAAAARGEFTVACCDHCGRLAMPPDVVCVGCRTSQPSFHDEPISGRGTVRSWTVIRTAFLPGFAAFVPYVLADVELDEQADLRLVSRVVGGEQNLAAGARARTTFEEIAPGFSVPVFVLEPAAAIDGRS